VQALGQGATLIILDNLEALQPEPLRTLLTVAKDWSEVGACRLLTTSRNPDLGHPDYANRGTLRHQTLPLRGLGSQDALAYWQRLVKLPPAPLVRLPDRDQLRRLFSRVDFHPLSIALLAVQVKDRPFADVDQALARLIAATPDNPLLASLNLSLARLEPEVRAWLPRLGVFEGGAMEDVLLKITGLGKVDEDPEIAKARQLLIAIQQGDPKAILRVATGQDLPDDLELPDETVQGLMELASQQIEGLEQVLANHPQTELVAGVDESTWQRLRSSLEVSGLIQVEYLAGYGFPFLRFHPTLAPVLAGQLTAEERDALLTRYRRSYYDLANYLYNEDRKTPEAVRGIARRELPNLLAAVRGAITAEEDFAVDFVNSVNRFLEVFGLTQEQADLTERVQALSRDVGSQTWFLSRTQAGEQLSEAGRYGEAAQIFVEILTVLGETASYGRCVTLLILGRCLWKTGQLAQAEECYRLGLAVAAQLAPSDSVTRQRGALQGYLADVLMDLGRYGEARTAYEASLIIVQELGDERNLAVVNGQFGTLAMREGNLPEAEQRYRAALTTFQQLHEPASEAVYWHQLGNVYQEAQQWDSAEQAYRASARLKEEQGDRQGAAMTWINLANVNQSAGKPEAAEAWYRKALAVFQSVGDRINESKTLYGIANLLQDQSDRLPEAQQLAEAALAIAQTLDPAATEIWKPYNILAEIAEKQGQATAAAEYRRLSRQAKANFAGTQHELQQHAQLIVMTVIALENAEVRQQLEALLENRYPQGWDNLIAAIQRILNGERDEEALLEPLDDEDAMIVSAILQGIRDPDSLRPFLP
jgi:tetratricopeptide (TPR) repeat protein